MKFSKFNLIIKEGDKRILFNTLSGECFKISIDVAEMIENNLLDQLNKELYDDFVEKGIIVDDQVEENRYFSYIQNQTRFNNNALSSTVLLTWACNLACIYCYEGAGCRTIRMNKATADRFIGFMINQAKTRNSKSMYINLFGGEPLLNIDCGFYILDELKKFCGEKNIEFASGIITNGTLLTAKIVNQLINYNCQQMENNLAKMMIETINNMMIELYASMAQAEMEKKEKRQKEGMEAKRLRGEWDEVGRPRAIEQEKFNQEFMRVVQKKVTPTQLQRELGLTSSTYYRYRKNFYEIFPEFLQSV